MSTHALFVTAAYSIAAAALAMLVGWVVADMNARRRELAELEARGVRRRSDRTPDTAA